MLRTVPSGRERPKKTMKIVHKQGRYHEDIWLPPDSQHFESSSEPVLLQLDVKELNPGTASCSEVTLLQPDIKELNPKTASCLGVCQIKVLLKYAEHLHQQVRQQITKQHLGQHLLSVIRRLQPQAGSTAQELGAFLKTLEAAGQRTHTLGSQLVWKVSNNFIVIRNFCSRGLVLGVIGQPWCKGTKITGSLKQPTFSTGIILIMWASVGLINLEWLCLSENTMVNLI